MPRPAAAGTCPEWLIARVLLDAAAVVLRAGHPHTALRLADAAQAIRGELLPSVPERREEARVRAAVTPGQQPPLRHRTRHWHSWTRCRARPKGAPAGRTARVD